jgi:hypothetical protein
VLLVGLAVACWHQRLDLKADQLIQVVAAQGGELPVGEDDSAVLIGDQDPVGESIGERLPGSPTCTAASELASYGSWAQRTTRTGRWA